MKLKEVAKKVEDGIDETLTCYDFPSEHWFRIRTNNAIERFNRESRRTRGVSYLPDGNSALKPVCAHLYHVAGTQWGNKKYMNMKHLEGLLTFLLKTLDITPRSASMVASHTAGSNSDGSLS